MIHDAVQKELKSQAVIHADEAVLKVNREPGRAATEESRIWGRWVSSRTVLFDTRYYASLTVGGKRRSRQHESSIPRRTFKYVPSSAAEEKQGTAICLKGICGPCIRSRMSGGRGR